MNSSSSSIDCRTKFFKMKNLIDDKLIDLLKDESYSRLRQMVERPTVKETDLENFWRYALPYVIQRVKAWNGYVLSAQNIVAMVERPPRQKKVVGSSKDHSQDRTIHPISRLDCISYIINAADSIVVQDILHIMAKFSMSIPLVIPDIKENGKYIVAVPALQNLVIKWESSPGQIAENHLFSSPFQMIVAVRLGTNKFGKSTILNQLMKKQYVFSSNGEPGSSYGRPLTLDGTVEIVWLTQETCSDITWNTTMCNHYKHSTAEVVILANLHGDALHYPDTIKYLEQLACSFIVFRMPDSIDNELLQLRKMISNHNLVTVLVDPKENVDERSDMEIIHTDSLTSDYTQDIVRCLMQKSLSFKSRKQLSSSKPVYCLEKWKSLRNVASLQCKKSDEILKYVTEMGCVKIKEFLLNFDFLKPTGWNESLKRLFKLFLDIVNLQQNDAKKSLTYLENQLSRLSAIQSVNARPQVSKAKEKLRRIVKAPRKSTVNGSFEDSQHEALLKKAQEELKSAMDKVDNMNLGQEHFFRALGKMYEKSIGVTDLGDFNSIRDLPSRLADLLISGHAIEMLNGDSGEIQVVWIKSIFEEVSKKLPNLKVFVISIIGLQSSGKSTLLNALFSCRFPVSVERCSRGFFMRMILLDEELRKDIRCDAFIIIDTEGLCSPEKMNDQSASQKDRLMATFAMGVSNLTMVNLLGEGMTEMTEILQIAIVAMARLRGGGIKPDILVVRHLQERNITKVDKAKGQFYEAINKAFELISKIDVEIGSASQECLSELTERIRSGDIFRHFGAFRDGSSVNSPPSEIYHEDVVSLLETLLTRTLELKNISTFERWSNHFESYWTCVQEENFALNFKNVKHITDFLYFEKKIAKVKEFNDSAIRHHREFCANKIRERINSAIAKKQKVITDSMRQTVLAEQEEMLRAIPHHCPEDCKKCKEFLSSYSSLLEEIECTEWEKDTKKSLTKYNEKLHDISMKVLRQTFDGSVVKQGCFSEFSDLITKELNKALEKKPTGKFNPKEQKEIVDKIWKSLQDIAASKESGPDLHTRMNQALSQEYVESGILPEILNDLKIEISAKDLLQERAIRSTAAQLTAEQVANLINDLGDLVTAILKNRRENCFVTGLDFEEGMVSEIKTKFSPKLRAYEKKFNITLQDKFKIRLQIYALQQFMTTMTRLQNLWNSQNKPSEILLRKKDEYINEIETRLKSGFLCAGEGEIVAKKLCKSIKLNAFQAGCDAKIQAINNVQWTTNSEKVRLHYFEELAKEVENGQKGRALAHFANPKDSIESWYTDQVNNLYSGVKVLGTYRSTLKGELNRVKQQILQTENKSDIDKIVKEQIKNADDQYYSQLDPKVDNFDAFKGSIVRILGSFIDPEDFQNIGLASDDPEIKSRLGCCESCFLCGALCWGSRDHLVGENSISTMEAHHSCHQPKGLTGVVDGGTNKLSSTACHNKKDDGRVCFGDFQDGDGILWSDAKQSHFKDWKFGAHCVTKFDELMRWFFQELHRDIARLRGCYPADDEDLRENKCVGLKLDEILKVVHSNI